MWRHSVSITTIFSKKWVNLAMEVWSIFVEIGVIYDSHVTSQFRPGDHTQCLGHCVVRSKAANNRPQFTCYSYESHIDSMNVIVLSRWRRCPKGQGIIRRSPLLLFSYHLPFWSILQILQLVFESSIKTTWLILEEHHLDISTAIILRLLGSFIYMIM